MNQFKRRGLIAIAGILVATILSPVLLLAISRLFHEDWVKLGNIGQAYGLASAALSGLALLAVAYSLIVQQHESAVTRTENQRALHTELQKMAIEDPTLIGILLVDPSETLEFKRRHLYINLLFQAMRVSYVDSTILGDESVRGEIGYIFLGSAGQRFWERRRELERKRDKSPREQAFFRIVDQAYTDSASKGLPPPYPEIGAESPRHKSALYFTVGIIVGATTSLGVILSRHCADRLKRERPAHHSRSS